MAFNLGNTIAAYVTYGWEMMNNPIIVPTVVFVEWVGRKISNIAMTVECVLTEPCTTIIIAKAESTNQIVQYVRSFYLAQGALLMKCPVAMLFTGTASRS